MKVMFSTAATVFALALLAEANKLPDYNATYCWDVLALHRGANQESIQQAYKEIAFNLHPSRNATPEAVRDLQTVDGARKDCFAYYFHDIFHNNLLVSKSVGNFTCINATHNSTEPACVMFEKGLLDEYVASHESFWRWNRMYRVLVSLAITMSCSIVAFNKYEHCVGPLKKTMLREPKILLVPIRAVFLFLDGAMLYDLLLDYKRKILGVLIRGFPLERMEPFDYLTEMVSLFELLVTTIALYGTYKLNTKILYAMYLEFLMELAKIGSLPSIFWGVYEILYVRNAVGDMKAASVNFDFATPTDITATQSMILSFAAMTLQSLMVFLLMIYMTYMLRKLYKYAILKQKIESSKHFSDDEREPLLKTL